MKKALKLALFALVGFSLLSVTAFAGGADSADGFWEEFLDTAPEGSVPDSYNDILGNVGVDSLLSEIAAALGGGIGEAASFLVLLLGISVLIAVSESANPLESSLSRHTAAGVSMISAVLIFGRMAPICLSVSKSLESLSAFFAGLIPIMTGILGAGGNINSAASQALNMNITLGVLTYISSSLLIPLVFALFALALAASMDSGGISSVAKGIKSVFMWLLGIGGTVIVGAVSMQSVITGAQDSAYLRAAKYAASGMIPVVGSTVSTALSTLAGGLAYIKSAVGISSVMIIIGLALSPLITLLLYRLAFSVAISFLDFMKASGGSRALGAFRASLDALISVYALSAVIYICEIVVFMKSGGEVLG